MIFGDHLLVDQCLNLRRNGIYDEYKQDFLVPGQGGLNTSLLAFRSKGRNIATLIPRCTKGMDYQGKII